VNEMQVQKVLAANSRARIVYRDQAGEYTERVIDVQSMYRKQRDGRLYISAYCWLRNEQRTFAIDGVRYAEPAQSTVVARFPRIVARVA